MMGSAVLRIALAAVLAAGLNAGTVLAQSKDRSAKGGAQVTAKQYVTRAAVSDLFEVESSKLALKKAQSSEVQAFARQMVDDHTRSSQKIEQAISSGGLKIQPPKKLDSEHRKMLSQLQSASGAKFDQLYVDMQVRGHEKAVQLHRGYAASGDNAALQKVAKTLAPIVEGHLAEVRRLARGSSRS